MGLTLSFIIGSSTTILEALAADDYDLMYDNITKEADFSFHLQPKDLQTLSICASNFNAKNQMGLREQMKLLLNDKEKGLFSVERVWVEYISAIPLEQAKDLCNMWFDEMQKMYTNKNLFVTEDIIQAVENLISLCQVCINSDYELLHYWTL